MADDNQIASDQNFLATDTTANPLPDKDPGTLSANDSTYAGTDKPETAAPRAQLVDPANYALDSAQKRYREAKAREDEADKELEGQYQTLRQLMAKTQQPLPQTPQLQPVQTVQPTPTQQQSIGNILGNVAAMVAIGTAIFGKRGGGWGTAITQAGVGAFLKNFAEARQEQSNEVFKQWKESQALIQQNNREKVQDYKDILADRRLDLSEQHAQLADLAYLRNDYKMYHAATQNAHAEVVKILEQQQKAADVYRTSAQKAQDKINETLIKKQESEQAAGKKVVSIPTFRSVADAMKYPIGTEFYDGKGVHYKITKTGKTAEDFEVEPVKDE